MEEQRLEEIWRENLRSLNGNVRLDSIIIRAMQEACTEAIKNQGDIGTVVICPKCKSDDVWTDPIITHDCQYCGNTFKD